ncbi:CRISPR-associated endonuclease/helicase Cas3 [Bacillus thuringiensis]|uniref:CRISPR-associated endonuclease/helicase Cas3 n=1 Tax=Bacillus thuringiensis TaxID=1428 RepID=A0A4R4B112_BACTU|nr:CRISPR-associated helicase Cas3' [Bacillus thuringiensis]TCW46910.1 CRISPR-associated endonuclease/helicase Cas3 [Bacillus thuringiensis]TCW47140.1 CRISPR-associated endonuclease/helicase Cas3 [Bacillus thuringiensis]
MGIHNYLLSSDRLFAHTNGTRKKETLEEHSNLTLLFYQKLKSENGLEEVLDRILNRLTFDEEYLENEVKFFIKKLFEQAVYLHDLGKINPAFQVLKMKNCLISVGKGSEYSDKTHSMLSALLYIDIFCIEVKEFEDEGIRGFLNHVLYTFAYCISRHHTYLEDIHTAEFYRKLNYLHRKLKETPEYVEYYAYKGRLLEELSVEPYEDIENFRFEDGHKPTPFYLLIKLLFSAIVSCDSLATYTYMNGSQPTFYYLQEENIEELMGIYHETDLYKGIQFYKQDTSYFNECPINALRSDLFLLSEEQILNNVDRNLFYLEAPTGSGKTNMSLNLSLKLLHQNEHTNKVVYVFPFNTLIEQTKSTFSKIYSEELQEKYRISLVNSVTPIVTKSELEMEEPTLKYEEELFRRQMLQYPVTLTSHVNFFNYIFGVGREANLALVHLCNSVVILDEIQSYRNIIWREIIHFLHEISECFNIKFIIMSATLPRLDKLLLEETCFVELIKDREQYFQHPLFKDRVKLHFELLNEEKITMEKLLNKIQLVVEEREKSRVLIEFISKKSARECYNIVKEKFRGMKVIELTGDDNNYYRNIILNEINKKDITGNFILENVIVVATQVIEAGVDIDMDIGFKDISIMDAEEQFLGRINRSCLRTNSHAYFFDLDKTETIYRNDLRAEKNLHFKEYQENLNKKDFIGFYQLNFKRLIERNTRQGLTNKDIFLNNIKYLEFEAMSKHMELISEKTLTLFISHDLILKNGELIEGEEVWEEYERLLNDKTMSYAHRQIEISRLKQYMSYFTYTLYSNGKPYPPCWDKKIGDIFYVKDGEKYMEIDSETGLKKFNREKYIDGAESMFL